MKKIKINKKEIKCKNCGKRDDLIYVYSLGENFCRVCFEDGVYQCASCMRSFWEDDKEWEYIDDKKYCIDCFKSIID
jgi:hypothetical protein